MPIMMQRGFTLIEMLIVVAIIGILAALLMPALRSALGVAKDASCLNNFRQIGIMEGSYISDNNNIMQTDRIHNSKLPEAAGASGLQSYYYWQHFLMPYNIPGATRITSYTTTKTIGGNTLRMASGVFACPAASFEDLENLAQREGGAAWQVRTNGKMGIAFNANANWAGWVSRVLTPSKTFMLMDMLGGAGTDQPCVASQLYSWGGGYGYPMWFSSYAVPPRHGGGFCLNVGFIDLHADAMTFGEMPNQGRNQAGYKWSMQ